MAGTAKDESVASNFKRIRQRFLLREAEGWLDLAIVFSDRWRLDPPLRNRLARRALEVLDRVPEDAGARAHALCLRGQAFRVMERWNEALEPLKAAADLDPASLRTWLALAWCYKRIGRLDLAIESLESALAADPNQAIVHYNLACYWSLARNVPMAVAYLARAFDIDGAYRDLVGRESDFDPIRRHPDFLALTSVIV